MITIVNYGLGNVLAIANIYGRLNVPVRLASTAQELVGAEKIILPGVGAFDWAMTRLKESGMREVLDDVVVGQQRPALGICVGMQMMANRSEEGVLEGLGWIDGNVRKFDRPSSGAKRPLPHMGWNEAVSDGNRLFRGIDAGARFYFLHSYYFVPQREADVLSLTDYCGCFASSVRCGSVFGVQFHPEKSHQQGIRLLLNFAEL
jgi:imidazole glycerol-phosphate synthase subunit HisH